MEHYLLIVEGKNDRSRLRNLVPESLPIALTNGIPSARQLERLEKAALDRQVVIITDADAAGRRIRRLLKDVFPDAIDIHTKPGHAGVEHTPLEYLEERLRFAGVIE